MGISTLLDVPSRKVAIIPSMIALCVFSNLPGACGPAGSAVRDLPVLTCNSAPASRYCAYTADGAVCRRFRRY